MKSIIASLFTIYALTSGSSNSRLLLQGAVDPAATGTGGAGTGGVVVELPSQATGPGNSRGFECVEPYQIEDPVTGQMVPNPNTCAGKPHTVNQPAHMSEFKFSALGAAAMATINLDFGVNGMTQAVNLLEFSEAYAGYKCKIMVNNLQTNQHVKINEVTCSTHGACNDMEIWLLNADLGDMSCPYPSYCSGCMIYVVGQVDPKTNLPIGTPCFGY